MPISYFALLICTVVFVTEKLQGILGNISSQIQFPFDYVEAGKTCDKQKSTHVSICTETYFMGECLEIRDLEEKRCVNANDLAPFKTNFETVLSIQLNGKCVIIYDDIHCSGKYKTLDQQNLKNHNNYNCLLSLSTCAWKATSISLCSAEYQPKYLKPNGTRGLECADSCETRNRSYFWCHQQNNIWDYCFPRPEQHFFGFPCGDTCVLPDFWQSENVVVYDSPLYSGHSLELIFEDSSTCINFLQSNVRSLSSVALKEKCVRFYIEIGCTGDYEELKRSPKDHLITNIFRSVSSCNATFPNYSNSSVGRCSGLNCVSSCRANGKPYFSCVTEEGSLDYCSPKAGMNFEGNMILHSNITADRHLWLPVFYDQKGFVGRNFTMGTESNRCYNIRFNDDHNSTNPVTSQVVSMDTKDFCVVLFDSIGCEKRQEHKILNGKALNTAGVADFRGSAWFSAKYCDTRLVDLFKAPRGSRGAPCVSKCALHDNLYFMCAIGSHNAWDFCSPRPNTDYFGDYCDDDCSHSSRPQTVTLYDGKFFQGFEFNVTFDKSKICYNLVDPIDSSVVFKGGISSLNLNGNCIELFPQFGCLGDPTEFVPSLTVDVCQSNTNHCYKDTQWLSLRFCTTDLPPACDVPYVSHDGGTCRDSCISHDCGRPNFTCTTGTGSLQHCSPRDGFDFTGDNGCTNCKCKYNPAIVIFEGIKFTGASIQYHPNEKSQCFNLDFDPRRSLNLLNKTTSVKLVGTNCIRLYDNIGCTGRPLEINAETRETCGEDINVCRTGLFGNVASISLCNTSFADSIFGQMSLSGRSCTSSCHASWNRQYFACSTNSHRKEYCNPRRDQNHIGQDCSDDNCIFQQPKQSALLFHKINFTGTSKQISLQNNTQCHSFPHTTGFPIESIWSNETSCLQVFDEADCWGNTRLFRQHEDYNCMSNLKACGWNTIASVKFCAAYQPRFFDIPVGASGHPCIDECKTDTSGRAWCHLENKSVDGCSSRPDLRSSQVFSINVA